MNKILRFISISHRTATVTQRAVYHIPDEEISSFLDIVSKKFIDISGIILLSTCNRTEIYFESVNTSVTIIRDFFIELQGAKSITVAKRFFRYSNTTEDTVNHLLEVSAGLESSVLGDVEIIHQIKKAHQFAIAHHQQGSLLERAMQAVFKSHKRISNETHFRDGTTSLAYKSLKFVRDSYEKTLVKNKRILFVGAGDIVKQLFKYNAKFNFNNIYISNRTEQRALDLSKEHHCKLYDWDKVLENNFDDFDVIVSAVSNYQNLIKKIPATKQKVLLIDLSVQGSMDRVLAYNENIKFYDLDAISEDLQDAKEKRFAAIDEVDKIIIHELSDYCKWLQEAPLRALLAEYKIAVRKKVNVYFDANKEEENIKAVTNQVMRKLMSHPESLMSSSKMNTIIAEQVNLFNEIHV